MKPKKMFQVQEQYDKSSTQGKKCYWKNRSKAETEKERFGF
jgi:hypothetical protein